jgi:hypothetical protein
MSPSDAASPPLLDPTAGIVVQLAGLGVLMRVEGGNLRLDGDIARLTPELIAHVRARKTELLALLMRCDERLSIIAGAATHGCEASAQRRHRLAWEAGGEALAVCLLNVDRSLNIDLLRATIARPLARHDVLRNTCTLDSVLDLVIDDVFDQAALDKLCALHAGRLAPAFQVWRIRAAHGESIAMLARRFVADEASLWVLLGEMANGYGTQAPAEDVRAPDFADFAFAEARMLAHPVNVIRSDQAREALGLRDAPAHRAGRIERRAWQLDATITDDWLNLAAEHGVAPLAILAAAFAFTFDTEALIEHLVLALPLPNRTYPELQNAVGPFENEIPIAAERAPTKTLSARFQPMHTRIANTYACQDLPCPVTSDSSTRAVRFALESERGCVLSFDGIRAVRSTLNGNRDDSALSLRHRHDDSGLRIDVAFDPDRMTRDTVERLLQRYLETLQNLRVFASSMPGELPRDAAGLARYLAAKRRDPAVALAKVCGIFAAVLGLAFVAPDGNFFELAGNSLAVAKVVSRVKREFGVAVSFSEVFRHPTPAALTSLILGRDDSAPLALSQRNALEEFPASPQQVRYFSSYNVAIGSSTRMTVLHGEWDDANAFQRAAEHLIERHELLRTVYFERDGKLMQRVLLTASLLIKRVTLAGTDPRAQQRELDGLIRKYPIDLRQPPLVQVVISDRGDGGLRSAFAVFNGILDAYSEGLLEEELRNAYALARTNTLATRPALKLQYQDFCRWQNELAQTDVHANAQAFWHALYPPDYPGFHYPVKHNTARAGEMRVFLLGEALSEAARAAAAECESSLFGFLLANFFELAAEIYQREDVSVGLLYHGRESEEMQDLIGYFVDLFCLRSNTNVTDDFAMRVKQVNETLFRSVDMRSYQYHELAARYGRSPSDPVFPITGFHVNNVIVPGKEKQVPADFTFQVMTLPYAPKFDFNIYVHESNRGILLRMAYATCVADEAQAARIAVRFIDIVRANTTAVQERHT